MQRIVSSEHFPKACGLLFPGVPQAEVEARLLSCHTVDAFQRRVMYDIIGTIVRRSTDGLTVSGLDQLQPEKSYLFVSNHRDIMLDAAFMQMLLSDAGLPTSEITFGANLMQGQLLIDLGRSNKMFRFERPTTSTSRRDFLLKMKEASAYIRYTICQKKESVWIAQRNGRTKDGLDVTDQGVINMFSLSGGEDRGASLGELNMVPVAISYEWEPCDKLKALELFARESGEPYVKKPGEDLNSILTGILQPKGHVHFEICKPITKDELQAYSHLGLNDFCKQVANLVDQRIRSAYHLTPNNYIACDLLTGTDTYASHYTAAEKEAFVKHASWVKEYSSSHDVDELLEIFLSIYANPVKR